MSAQIFFLKNRGEKVADWSDIQKIEKAASLMSRPVAGEPDESVEEEQE